MIRVRVELDVVEPHGGRADLAGVLDEVEEELAGVKGSTIVRLEAERRS